MDTEKIIKRIQRVSLSCELKTEEGIRHFHNGHEYVEIGGVKWATMNVGAEKPTDYGLYFQWGDVQGYTADQVGRSVEGKKYFDWEDYKYGNGIISLDGSNMTKYNKTDGKKVLDLEDDAVRANWGGSWRMPTNEEMNTLRNAVNTAWTADYQGSGVGGMICTDKTNSSKKLFIPAAGYAFCGSMRSVGSGGFVWSNSLNSNGVDYAWYLYFIDKHSPLWDIYYLRYYGYSVRGVVA